MENEQISEGRKLVMELMEMGCSKWSIMKELGVSYATVKAWARGWWNPSYPNTFKLHAMKAKKQQEKLRKK